MSDTKHPRGGLVVRPALGNHRGQFIVANAVSYGNQPCIDPDELPSWDEFYVEFGGYFGGYGPHLFATAPELLEALEGVLRVADRATVEFDAARAAIARAKGGAA